MAATPPLDVSVVMPLHNGARHLRSTLEAIARQTLRPREVVVVDDASTDEGPAIATGFGQGVVCLPSPARGVQAARNRGIEAAQAGWIAFCDADDIWPEDYLARHAALLRAEPEIDFSFANFRTLTEAGVGADTKFDQAPPGWWDSCRDRALDEGWVLNARLVGQTFRWHPIFPSGTVMSRDLALRAGGYDTALHGKIATDGEFTLRCLYRARRVGALPETCFLYRRHTGNYTSNQLRNLLGEVDLLEFIKRTHEEAKPWHAVIDSEIGRRRRMAVHAAFAQRQHDTARRLLAQLPKEEMSLRLRAKAACLALPDSIGIRLNGLLQQVAEAASRRQVGRKPSR